MQKSSSKIYGNLCHASLSIYEVRQHHWLDKTSPHGYISCRPEGVTSQEIFFCIAVIWDGCLDLGNGSRKGSPGRELAQNTFFWFRLVEVGWGFWPQNQLRIRMGVLTPKSTSAGLPFGSNAVSLYNLVSVGLAQGGKQQLFQIGQCRGRYQKLHITASQPHESNGVKKFFTSDGQYVK